MFSRNELVLKKEVISCCEARKYAGFKEEIRGGGESTVINSSFYGFISCFFAIL